MARLTKQEVETAEPGRHSDGDGLHLFVSEMGRKKWVLRYQAAGVRKDKGLGGLSSDWAQGGSRAGLRSEEARRPRGRPDRGRQSR